MSNNCYSSYYILYFLFFFYATFLYFWLYWPIPNLDLSGFYWSCFLNHYFRHQSDHVLCDILVQKTWRGFPKGSPAFSFLSLWIKLTFTLFFFCNVLLSTDKTITAKRAECTCVMLHPWMHLLGRPQLFTSLVASMQVRFPDWKPWV